MSRSAPPYRIVQWATGNVGAHAIKAVLAHPQMTLVGVYVHSPEKAGRDAGELCGLDETIGIAATNRIEDILALKPDCVLYMQQGLNVDDVCRLLEAGCNVATSVAEFHHPASLDPAVRERVEAACRKGGTSIYATGSSPGFISETIPLALATIVRRIDKLTIDEFADLSSRDSPGMIFDVMGYGKPLTPFDARRAAHMKISFGESFHALADALGIELDSIEAGGEYAATRNRVEIAAGVLEAGTVGAQRISVTGLSKGLPILCFRANWYCTTDLQPAWDISQSGGWRVQVEGDTPLDVRITFPCSAEDYPQISPGFTAHPVVNAVAAVCAAEPGIRTTADLKVVTRLGKV